MRGYGKEAFKKVDAIILLVIIIVVVLSFYGASEYISLIMSLTTWIITAILTTAFVQVLIQKTSGDFFDKIPLTLEAKGFKFKISLFAIITVILKMVIFS